ncbi:hypothetical protein DVH24_008847 [Malus domestica]|uniref:Uncharacterized protein n=1 Tax=Malus domestica TaxID=3750 RepID=A0A498JR28_MALDO|nr:hypothetical protein DVH24_008847 [Malus domestica]
MKRANGFLGRVSSQLVKLENSNKMLEGPSYLVSRELPSSCEQESKWIYNTHRVMELSNTKRPFEDGDEITLRKACKLSDAVLGGDVMPVVLRELDLESSCMVKFTVDLLCYELRSSWIVFRPQMLLDATNVHNKCDGSETINSETQIENAAIFLMPHTKHPKPMNFGLVPVHNSLCPVPCMNVSFYWLPGEVSRTIV